MVSGPGRKRKLGRATSRISAAQASIASAVYGFGAASSNQQERGRGPRGARVLSNQL